MNTKIVALIKDLQSECLIFEGNCLGGINSEGCSRADVCLNLFSNNFIPCEHKIEELYQIVMKED